MTMVIEIDAVMRQLASHQLQVIAPETKGYERYFVSLSALVMLSVADEFDSAAMHCLEENDALRALLQRGLAGVISTTLQKEISLALRVELKSIRVSEIQQDNRQLRTLLIALHEEVERALPAAWAHNLNREIWQELLRASQRYSFASLAALV